MAGFWQRIGRSSEFTGQHASRVRSTHNKNSLDTDIKLIATESQRFPKADFLSSTWAPHFYAIDGGSCLSNHWTLLIANKKRGGIPIAPSEKSAWGKDSRLSHYPEWEGTTVARLIETREFSHEAHAIRGRRTAMPCARTTSAFKSSGRNLRMIKQSQLNEWNRTWWSLLLTRLFSMNENSNETLPQQEEGESFRAWLKRNRLDNGQPWLFYGEDELFEDVIWTFESFCKDKRLKQKAVDKYDLVFKFAIFLA